MEFQIPNSEKKKKFTADSTAAEPSLPSVTPFFYWLPFFAERSMTQKFHNFYITTPL
jgi:hypothetical protein